MRLLLRPAGLVLRVRADHRIQPFSRMSSPSLSKCNRQRPMFSTSCMPRWWNPYATLPLLSSSLSRANMLFMPRNSPPYASLYDRLMLTHWRKAVGVGTPQMPHCVRTCLQSQSPHVRKAVVACAPSISPKPWPSVSRNHRSNSWSTTWKWMAGDSGVSAHPSKSRSGRTYRWKRPTSCNVQVSIAITGNSMISSLPSRSRMSRYRNCPLCWAESLSAGVTSGAVGVV
mmetsp:Transcript_56652/g.165723  ORF Transcript_56652/g.165723 Transcript_56652/m.165723 type:complete len:228 (+) Transcript_56652:86-769(+)